MILLVLPIPSSNSGIGLTVRVESALRRTLKLGGRSTALANWRPELNLPFVTSLRAALPGMVSQIEPASVEICPVRVKHQVVRLRKWKRVNASASI